MLLFAHAGITLGAATLTAGAAKGISGQPAGRFPWFTALGSYVDIRILLIGSLLPDIIDKPLGQIILRDVFSNGRIFAHTLLFFVLITAAGLLLYRFRHRVWLLTLAGGTFMHLLLDEIWLTPRTFLWPFLGLSFDRIYLTGWLSRLLEKLLGSPMVFIWELAGLVVLLWFAAVLVRRRYLVPFIFHGKVG